MIGEQTPAIVSIDLETGGVRRILENHSSFLPNDEGMKVDGKLITLASNGKQVPIQLGLNPIAIDPANEWVYYGPANPGSIYRISAALLADSTKSKQELEAAIEMYGPKPATDGIAVDAAGNVYVTSVSENAIGVVTKNNYRVLIKDDRLSWTDGIPDGGDGYFYVTVNQLHKAALFHGGVNKGTPPYLLVRFKSLTANAGGR